MPHRNDAEIDAIVDEIVSDEKTAAALKRRLHDEDDAPQTPAASAPAAEAGARVDTDDDSDLWDNLPV